MVRRLLHALVVMLTLIIGATVAAVIVSQTAWFKDWLRAIEREATMSLNGHLSINAPRRHPVFRHRAREHWSVVDGTQVATVKGLGVNYSVSS